MSELASDRGHMQMRENTDDRSVRWAVVVLVKIPQILMAGVLTLLIVFLVAAVVSRYFMDIGMPWADEFARILFAWIVMVGFALAVQQRSNVGVEWLVLKMPPAMKQACYVLQDIVILIFSVVFTYAAWQSFKFSKMQILPALDVTIGWLYGSVVAAGGLMIVYSIFNVIESLRGQRQDTHFDAPEATGGE